ncbi:hypothetical protein Tsp_09144 [Trichinella spiralis]|uniref:hypothetical protein n=1 Tax=Trichinella spiralis TaxID=6334 RepID=UPI0001EFCD68|nr:hypothetical protein Tsp_09144 [Trichinella spiralis]
MVHSIGKHSKRKLLSTAFQERAPWMGSYWERRVRSMKESLRKILKKALLDEEELFTTLCKVEACLTFVGDESHDRHPLSLLQLMTGRTYVDFPTVEVSYPEWQSSGRGPPQWNQRRRYRQRPAVLSSRHTISWCHGAGVAARRTVVRKTMVQYL